MNIICLKWGNKFSYKHVNRLYRMVCKNYKDDFTFICYTEDPTGISSEVQIVPLDLNEDLEKWWWKLTLFKQISDDTLFFDLDVVIQNDITHFKSYINRDRLTVIKAYWKPDKEFPDMNYNSSVMCWSGDLRNIWQKFSLQPDYYMLQYNGIDSFLYYECSYMLNTFPRKEIYSRLFGIDENNFFDYPKAKDYFYDDTYSVCIFNGWRRDVQDTKYLLDNEGYNGFKHYWD